MTNIKYSKRFKLRNGERVDFCPECDYHITDGVIHNETLFNKNNIKFLLLKKSGKYYKSYFEAEKHLKEDYEYLTGE